MTTPCIWPSADRRQRRTNSGAAISPPRARPRNTGGVSGENAEIVRRGVDAYNRRDDEGVVENWADDAVVDWSNSRGPDAGVYRGLDEIRAFIRRFQEMFDEVRMVIEDLQDTDDGSVVVETMMYGRGRDAIEVQARSAWLVTFDDGEQTSLTMYQSREEALEAARAQD